MATIQTKHNWIRRLAGITLVLTFTFLIPWYLYSTIQDPTSLTDQVQLSEVSTSTLPSEQSFNDYVDILSVPPARAIIGEKYIYDLDIKYSGTGDLTYKLKGQPAWLSWDKAKKRLSGVPPQNASVVAKVSLEVTDGTVNDRQDYTLILARGATTVLPIQANNSSTSNDPFTGQGSINQAVLGASTSNINTTGNLPDTAIGSWLWGVIGIGLIFFGTIILNYYKIITRHRYSSKKIESGGVLEIEEDSSTNFLIVSSRKSG